MVTSPFMEPAGWKITSWVVDEKGLAQGIPNNGFTLQSTLLIGVMADQVLSLQWLDQNGQPCSVLGLQSNQIETPSISATALEGDNLVVQFGLQGMICDVTLSLDSTNPEAKTLTGTILIPISGVPETGSGTFTATANSGGN